MKILLAADGSDYTREAAAHLAKHIAWFNDPEVRVHHVRQPIPYPGAASAIGKEALDTYHREEADKAIAVAKSELLLAKVPCVTSFSQGDVAHEIRTMCRRESIDLVVIGSHGHGAIAQLALGSVAMKLIATLEVPVLVIR